MKLEATTFERCFFVHHDIYKDERGQFFEAFNLKKFKAVSGLNINFVQDNVSISKKGVLRGLHFQKEPYQQAKLITVLRGEVIDVVVDIRKNSKTFGKHLKFNMGESDGKSLFIPKGMAHGFLAISDNVIFQYKCDAHYQRDSERGIRYDDKKLAIDWEFSKEEIILSEKDKKLPSFEFFLQ